MALKRSVVLEKNLYEDWSDSMEGIVVELRARSPCKRFAIKDNVNCDRPARGFDGDSAKPHSFFSLRTMRVVTCTSANLSGVPFGLPTKRELAVRCAIS
jgi:hypothetical protein